jgi:hypothetical protein
VGVRLLPLWLLCVALTGCSPTATEQTTAYNCCPCCDCCRPHEPVPPVRPGPPEIDTLFQLSKASAVKLDDGKTAGKLGAAILRACDAAEVSSTLIESIRIVQDAIRKVLEERDGLPDNVDWRNGWRAPVSDLVAVRSPTTPKAYAETMRFAARGLLAAAMELGE